MFLQHILNVLKILNFVIHINIYDVILSIDDRIYILLSHLMCSPPYHLCLENVFVFSNCWKLWHHTHIHHLNIIVLLHLINILFRFFILNFLYHLSFWCFIWLIINSGSLLPYQKWHELWFSFAYAKVTWLVALFA